MAIRTDGTLAAWGDNSRGQTNSPAGTFMAISVGGSSSAALKADGSVVAWGSNDAENLNVPPGLYTAISMGGLFSLGLAARDEYDGNLRIFGSGNTANLNRSVAVAGDLIVETAVQQFNNAVAEVDGRLILRAGANLGSAAYQVHGLRLESNYSLPATAHLANAGPLSGTGSLALASGARLDIGLAPSSFYTGTLSLGDGAAVSLRGAGLQTAHVLGLASNAALNMAEGQTLRLTNTVAGSALLNSGRISMLGGAGSPSRLDVAGSTLNNAGGSIIGHDVDLRFGAGLINSGAVTWTGGMNDVSGTVLNMPSGRFLVTGDATTVFYNDVINNGAITVRASANGPATAIFLGSVSGAGSIGGGGNLLFEGNLSPGNSPGAVTFDNSVMFGHEARLTIELGGTTAGSLYDRVQVTGTAALGGTLQVSLVNGFQPALGQSFTPLVFGSRSGDFSSYAGLTLAGHLTLRPAFVGNSLVLTARPTIDGDINTDGFVNGQDLARVASNWLTPHVSGDVNGDGVVNGQDISTIASHWLQSDAGHGAALDNGASVPEPATAVLLMLGVAAAFWLRRSV